MLSLLRTPGAEETPKWDSFYNQVRKSLSFNRGKKQPEVFNEIKWLQIAIITCKNSLFPPDSN